MAAAVTSVLILQEAIDVNVQTRNSAWHQITRLVMVNIESYDIFSSNLVERFFNIYTSAFMTGAQGQYGSLVMNCISPLHFKKYMYTDQEIFCANPSDLGVQKIATGKGIQRFIS